MFRFIASSLTLFALAAAASSAAIPSRFAAGGGHLGPVLTTADGGQIFGFAVDQHGSDGVLASAKTLSGNGTLRVSVETFDTASGQITRSFARYTGLRNSYKVDAIAAGDVALVTHDVTPAGTMYARRQYDVMNPVTAERFTGRWTPPVDDIDVLETADNQTTATSVSYAIELQNGDVPDLIVSDVAQNAFGRVIHLGGQFALNASPQLAQDTLHNQAVMASSPDAGAVGGPPPVISTVDLATGKLTQFNGVNCPDGIVGCGYANGLAYDSATGIACTTTELDGGIEFYDVAKHTGFNELLPNPSQFNAGGAVASDPVHRLFLIAQPNSSSAPQGSSIYVYAENGALLETLNGFNFTFASFSVIAPSIALDPAKRIGWVNGPSQTQLQQFSY